MSNFRKENKDEIVSMRFTKTEKALISRIAEELNQEFTEIMRFGVIYWLSSDNDIIISPALKHLAQEKLKDLKLDILKEMEYMILKQATVTDGFKTKLEKLYHKYSNISHVKRFVTLRLMMVFEFKGDKTEDLSYIKRHFKKMYPHCSKWLDEEIKRIRAWKRTHKGDIFNEKGKRKLPQNVVKKRLEQFMDSKNMDRWGNPK